MQARFPENEDSEDARLGTAAHWFASEALAGRMVEAETPAPNGVPVSTTMMDDCQPYIRECRSYMEAGWECYVEQTVAMAALVHAANWGTPDFFAVNRAQKLLVLIDFKYGHRYVDAFRNPQLFDYLAGIFESLGLGDFDGWAIEAVIHQPRNWHPEGQRKSWKPDAEVLWPMLGEFQQAAVAAVDPNALCRTGEHCRDCPAAHGCTVLQSDCGHLVEWSGIQHPHVLDNDALGLELAAIKAAMKRLSSRVTGLEEQALAVIAQGGRVKGWTAEHSYGRERFTIPAEKVVAWCSIFGVDAKAPLATLTPNQLRQKGVPAESLDAITEKPRGAYTLVQVTKHSLAKGLSTHG